MNVLVLNVGSASLKFEVVATSDNPSIDQMHKLASGTIEEIGDNAVFSELKDKQVIHQQQITAHDYEEATKRALEWLDKNPKVKFDIVGHRVVHGADKFSTTAIRVIRPHCRGTTMLCPYQAPVVIVEIGCKLTLMGRMPSLQEPSVDCPMC